jgi:SOS response regulatory protein OraA/RecX
MPRTSGQDRRESLRERRERRALIDDPEIVLNAAARFLEVRSRSVHELRRHLAQAGYRADLVQAAVARLTELGMLDDATFARTWVESRDRARPRSEAALRRELSLKGIDRELAVELLDERRGSHLSASGAGGAAEGGGGDPGEPGDGPDMLAAGRLLAKRGGALARIADARVRRQRAYAMLARNGFDPEVCRDATNRFFAAAPESATHPMAGDD